MRFLGGMSGGSTNDSILFPIEVYENKGEKSLITSWPKFKTFSSKGEKAWKNINRKDKCITSWEFTCQTLHVCHLDVLQSGRWKSWKNLNSIKYVRNNYYRHLGKRQAWRLENLSTRKEILQNVSPFIFIKDNEIKPCMSGME